MIAWWKEKQILQAQIVTLIFLPSHNSQTYVNNDRLCRGAWGDNEWYNKWQQMITNGKTSDREWKQMVERVTTKDNEWY